MSGGMAGVGAFLQLAGTGVEMYGQWLATDYQVEELKISEKQARERALQAGRARDWRVRMIHEAGVQMTGEIEAETGKSGLAMSGTPLEHKVRQGLAAELTASMAYEAGTYEVETWLNQADAYRRARSEADKAGGLQRLGTLIGGISGAGSMMGGIGQ
jgi:hypothetical protein